MRMSMFITSWVLFNVDMWNCFCLALVKKRSFLTSCELWFLSFWNACSRLCFRFVVVSSYEFVCLFVCWWLIAPPTAQGHLRAFSSWEYADDGSRGGEERRGGRGGGGGGEEAEISLSELRDVVVALVRHGDPDGIAVLQHGHHVSEEPVGRRPAIGLPLVHGQ